MTSSLVINKDVLRLITKLQRCAPKEQHYKQSAANQNRKPRGNDRISR